MTNRRQNFTPIQWLLVVACLLVLLLIVGLVSTYFDDQRSLQRAALETSCALQYVRDTAEWRTCVRAG